MAPTATMTLTHPGGRARVAIARRPCRPRSSTMAPSAVVAGESRRRRRRRRWPRTRWHQTGDAGAEPSPRAIPGGWPGAPLRRCSSRRPRSRRLSEWRLDPATARARRRPALRRSATGASTGPDRSRRCEEDRRRRSSRRRTTVPSAASATRSASSGSAGRSTVTSPARPSAVPARAPSARRRGPSRASGRVAGCRRASRGGRPRGSPTLGRGPVERRHRSLRRAAAATARRARPRAVRRGAARAEASCTRRVHHCSAKGAADAMSRVTESMHAAPLGSQRDDPSCRRVSPAGPDERLGAGRVNGAGRARGCVEHRTMQRDGTAGDAVGRSAATTDTVARATTRDGPTMPMQQGPEDEVAEDLHPARAAVVGDQPPQAEDQHGGDHRRPGAGRPRPAAHGLGVGVASSSSCHGRLAQPMPSSPSSMRIRWARQPTATAFTSSGATKSRDERTAWACAERMSQMAARGLAPRWTPGAVRLARQSSTA